MFQLVDAEKAHYPVAVLCEVLEVSRSGYYDWRKRPSCERSKADAQLAVQIAAAHTKSRKRYGSPRVHRALRRKGIRVGKKRVERLMRENAKTASWRARNSAFGARPIRITSTRSRRTSCSASSSPARPTRSGPGT
jgi:putative transposase